VPGRASVKEGSSRDKKFKGGFLKEKGLEVGTAYLKK